MWGIFFAILPAVGFAVLGTWAVVSVEFVHGEWRNGGEGVLGGDQGVFRSEVVLAKARRCFLVGMCVCRLLEVW